MISVGEKVLKKKHQSKLLTYGLAVSAHVSCNGIIHPPDLSGWDNDNISITGQLNKAFDVTGVIDNDANLGTLAEYRYGEFAGVQNLLYVLIHHGVGAVIICKGHILRGDMNWAGEIGHMVINPLGPLCSCGNYGCLESYVSNKKVIEYTITGVKFGRPTKLSPLGLDNLDIEMVIDSALTGDQSAIMTFQQVGEWLGLGLSNVVNILNPKVVVLGGTLARAGNLLLDPLKYIVCQRILPNLRKRDIFATSTLGDNGPLIGAISYAMDRALDIDNIIVKV